MCYSILKLLIGETGCKEFVLRARAVLGMLKQVAPYAAIELILPGGTLLAILFWLYRRRRGASLLRMRLANAAADATTLHGASLFAQAILPLRALLSRTHYELRPVAP